MKMRVKSGEVVPEVKFRAGRDGRNNKHEPAVTHPAPPAQQYLLSGPLRLGHIYQRVTSMFNRTTAGDGGGKYHYIDIHAGEHLIVIEATPTGRTVRVYMDGELLRSE